MTAARKRAELKSVLDPATKKRVGKYTTAQTVKRSLRVITTEIIIQRIKKWAPEEIARHLLQFDPELCTELFLSELKRVLPTPEQV